MNRTMSLVIIAFLFLTSIVSFAGDNPMKAWTANYNHLVSLLESTNDVGDCGLSLSTDPNNPEGSWTVNILRVPGGVTGFDIFPPVATGGESQVDFIKTDLLRYRQSDIVGWINMTVYLDKNGKIITGIALTKTLPNGTVS